jgi:pyridoxamine 5'-phosphate oxidase
MHSDDLDPNPINQFQLWFAEAEREGVPEPEAMTLATATKAGVPSARTVLLKGIDSAGFHFFTNYDSKKGRELTENPVAALNFYWHLLGRQVGISGHVQKLTIKESESYFHSRPRDSQIGAWASPQSRVLQSRSDLKHAFAEAKKRLGSDEIPLPPFWGGFRLTPNKIEFWEKGESRLHDRILYSRRAAEEGGKGDGTAEWTRCRLAP